MSASLTFIFLLTLRVNENEARVQSPSSVRPSSNDTYTILLSIHTAADNNRSPSSTYLSSSSSTLPIQIPHPSTFLSRRRSRNTRNTVAAQTQLPVRQTNGGETRIVSMPYPARPSSMAHSTAHPPSHYHNRSPSEILATNLIIIIFACSHCQVPDDGCDRH